MVLSGGISSKNIILYKLYIIWRYLLKSVVEIFVYFYKILFAVIDSAW